MKTAVTRMFAIIGVIAVVLGCAVLLLRRWDSSYDEFSLLRRYPSSDGKLIAQVYQRAGGAFVTATWCTQGIAILPSTAAIRQETVIDARIYESDCDDKVDAAWTSASVLQVSFSGAYTPMGTQAYLRGYSQEKTIKIEFHPVSD